ncbi:MAG: PH domain-containing protein [Acidimicrobiales bacterium]
MQEGEELLAEVRPHPIVVVGPVLLLGVAVAGAATIAVRYPGAPLAVAWLLAAMIVLPALWLLARVLRWRSVRFVVTTNRLLYRRGVVGRDVVQLRFRRVAEVHLSQTAGGRLIGCGRLVFEVAGSDSPLVVEDVRRPRRLQRVITAQLDRFDLPYDPYDPLRERGARTSPVPAGTARAQGMPQGRRGRQDSRAQPWGDTPPHGLPRGDGEADAATIPEQILQLDELRRRGILSEHEFAAKKAELLGRL